MLKKYFFIFSILVIVFLLILFSVNKIQANWNKNTYFLSEKLLFDAYKYYQVKTPEDIITKSSINIEKNATINDYYYRGLAYQAINENEKAIKDFDIAITVNSKNANIYKDKCNSLLSLERYKEAKENCQKAIELNPDLGNAYNGLGLVECNYGDCKKAIEYFDKAIELNPDMSIPYSNRGLAKNKLNMNEEAMVDYNKAIELDKNNYRIYAKRGFAYYIIGKYREAIADYDKAIKLNKNDSRVYYHRGLCKEAIGDIKGAYKDYEKAKKLNPNMK